MSVPIRPAPWRTPGWLDEVTSWTDASLARAGLTRTGALERRERAWSIVLTVDTDGGRVYVKETAAAMANDAAITAHLSRLDPAVVRSPVVVDADRRRMILPDAGELLRDLPARQLEASHWERLLPRYAALQQAAAFEADELRAAGALPREPSRIAGLLDDLLSDAVARGVAGQAGLSSDELRSLDGLRPTVAAAAAELESIGPGVSIQHDDLHDGNVLLDAGGAYSIIDWGDAQVAHPFATLLVTLRSAAVRFEVPDDDPLIGRLRDAYLEPWRATLGRQELDRAVSLATWLGMLGRALAWRASYETANVNERIDCAEGVVGWLKDFVEAAQDSATRP